LLGVPATGVVGHSFGGKVALALAQAHPELLEVMTLDSAPGPRLDARGSEATVRVVTMLQSPSSVER
jgi:esterase